VDAHEMIHGIVLICQIHIDVGVYRSSHCDTGIRTCFFQKRVVKIILTVFFYREGRTCNGNLCRIEIHDEQLFGFYPCG
ncbi:MAG: hypothetical protein WCF90_10070, partial [Methanomicrobiales archaeon]